MSIVITEILRGLPMQSLIIVIFITMTVGIFYTSIFEWVFHKYVMHRPLFGFKYPYVAHTQTHHAIFRWDASYHVQRKEDANKIPMAWWNSIALILIAIIPFVIGGVPFAILQWWGACIAIIVTGCAVLSTYYGTYEYLHWCMHLPKKRQLEKLWPFKLLNGHHLLHHRYMNKNFNVVLPLADFLFGTLLTRAKTKFAQARGDSVPDVQPLASPA